MEAISLNLKNENDDMRFYLGWGLFVVVFALSLIVQYLFGNLGITLGFFFTILALSLIILGLTKPVMPLVTLFGGLNLLVGIALLGVLVARMDPFLVGGIIILIIGIFLLVFKRSKLYV